MAGGGVFIFSGFKVHNIIDEIELLRYFERCAPDKLSYTEILYGFKIIKKITVSCKLTEIENDGFVVNIRIS